MPGDIDFDSWLTHNLQSEWGWGGCGPWLPVTGYCGLGSLTASSWAYSILLGSANPFYYPSSLRVYIWINGWLSQKTASRLEGWSGKDLSSRWPGPGESPCAVGAAEWELQVTAGPCSRQTRPTRARPAPLSLLCLVILSPGLAFTGCTAQLPHWALSGSCFLLFRSVTFRHR